MKIQYILAIAINLSAIGVLNAKGTGSLIHSENKCKAGNLIEHDNYKVLNREAKPYASLKASNEFKQELIKKTNFTTNSYKYEPRANDLKNTTNNFCNHFFIEKAQSTTTINPYNYALDNASLTTYALKPFITNELKIEKTPSILNTPMNSNYMNYLNHKTRSTNNIENILNTDSYSNTIAFIDNINELVTKGKSLFVLNIN